MTNKDTLLLKAKQEAGDCPHDHKCLEGKQGHLCKVIAEYGEKVLLVKITTQKNITAYCNSFADECLCTCPVRYCLFKESGR
ncbi:MAG: hypothetical protein C1941_07685 [Prosthecochloris sp.]|nr:hypothetical protein [Prosthecochloris sp.]